MKKNILLTLAAVAVIAFTTQLTSCKSKTAETTEQKSDSLTAPVQEPNDSMKTTAPAEEPKKEEKK